MHDMRIEVVLASDDQVFLEEALAALHGGPPVATIPVAGSRPRDVALLEPDVVVLDLCPHSRQALRFAWRLADDPRSPRRVLVVPEGNRALRVAAVLMGAQATPTRRDFLRDPRRVLDGRGNPTAPLARQRPHVRAG